MQLICIQKDFACSRKIIDDGGFCLFPFKTRAFQSNFALKIYECAGSPPL